MSIAQAQVFQGPISSALGGSGRAGLDANEGAFLNPALIPLIENSEMTAYFRDGSLDNGTHRNSYGVSLSETKDVLIPGALAYVKSRNTGLAPAPVDGDVWFGGVGYLFFSRLSAGVSLYRVSQKEIGQARSEQWNFSLGGLFLITPSLGVAYVFENPLQPSKAILPSLRLKTQQSVGVFYRSPFLARLRMDLIRQEQFNDDKQINVAVGVETELNPYLISRIGGRWDEIDNRRFITAGIGLNAARLKVDYSFEKNVKRASGAVHSVDLRVSF